MEDWSELSSFPGYSVSDQGRVRNDRTNMLLRIIVNQLGIAYVGMRFQGTDYKRAVAPLVAHAFLPYHQHQTFDTPINRDGDRLNNVIDNLLWRPRWFAVKYHRQFRIVSIGIQEPIVDLDTTEEFPSSWEAAVKFGLIDRDILISVHREEYVWPTYQRFQIIRKRY